MVNLTTNEKLKLKLNRPRRLAILRWRLATHHTDCTDVSRTLYAHCCRSMVETLRWTLYIWWHMTMTNFNTGWFPPPSCDMKQFSLWYRWNTLCWQAIDHTDIYDYIPNSLFFLNCQCCCYSAVPHFSVSFFDGCLPETWKYAIVTPLHKKDPRLILIILDPYL